MREKFCGILNKIYGAIMMIAFFGGLLPLIPFVIAMIIGGDTGEAIAVFLNKQYYPWIIALASVAVVVGLINMYVAKQQGLSVKSIQSGKEKQKEQ